MRIKLTIIAIIAAVFIAPSFADNAKTTTSKGYVDTQIATKQDKVPAVDTNTVITTTGTTGEIGEKAIYNASGNYATQTDALVTAADANAAVQNAIDTEFVCVEWAPNTTETPENCYIWSISAQRRQNLLDPSHIHQGTIIGTQGSMGQQASARNRCYFDYVRVHAGDIVNITSKADTPPVYNAIWLYSEPSESTIIRQIFGSRISIGDNTGYKFTISQDGYIRGLWVQNANFTPDDVVNPMLEISATPHEYVPYENVYMPTGN